VGADTLRDERAYKNFNDAVSLIDAGIVGKTKTVDSTSVKFDPVHGLGMMNGLPKPYDVKGTKSV
jgi:hypothetical protein